MKNTRTPLFLLGIVAIWLYSVSPSSTRLNPSGPLRESAIAPSAWFWENSAQTSSRIASELIINYLGNDESTHYHQPIWAVVENPSNREIRLEIPVGSTYKPGDPDYQDLIVTEPLIALIPPHSKQKIAVHAMCIEPNDYPQDSEISYTLHPPEPSGLTRFAAFAQGKGFSESAIQDGLWSLLKKTIWVDGWNEDEVREISTWIAQELGEEVPDFERMDPDEYLNGRLSERSVKISGSFTVNSSRETDVVAGLFDTQKRLVREFYRNEHTPPGRHKIEYAYDGAPYLGDTYIHMLIVDGRISLELPMDLASDNE